MFAAKEMSLKNTFSFVAKICISDQKRTKSLKTIIKGWKICILTVLVFLAKKKVESVFCLASQWTGASCYYPVGNKVSRF